MANKDAPKKDPIDIHVGARLKARRVLAGISQEKLADALGVTFQQVQKYENGTNRLGASRMFKLAEIMDVTVGYFFDGYQDDARAASPFAQSEFAVAEEKNMALSQPTTPLPSHIAPDVLSQKETLDLIKAYYNIEDKALRQKVLAMVQGFGH